jgi:protein ImuB
MRPLDAGNAMLWLCLYLPQFALELQPSAPGPVAVAEHHGARRRLIACNAASLAAGLHNGLDATTARLRLPHLELFERSKSREHAAFKALGAWAGQFSSMVCFDAERWLLWIEVGASLRYFNGMTALLHNVTSSIHALGYTALPGIAPTPEAAALLAQHAHASPILQREQVHERLASLPLALLALAEASVTALHGVGLRRIGEVLDIPREQLARRFGPELIRYLQRLLGECADPRIPYRAPATYRRSFELAAPITLTEALLFPLQRLLGELQGYLRARDTALQSLLLTLRHAIPPNTVLELRTTTPQRDSARLLALLREQLQRTRLFAPVTELVLSVRQFTPLGATQLNLFATSSREQGWVDLLDKLRARLGEQAVRRLGLQDDHRPEKAWCLLHGDAADTPPAGSVDADRPLWLLPATPLQQLPRLLGKPERIEAGWWNGADVQRDYYIGETAAGSRCWLYRDARTRQWYLQGLWA